jgi:hypothetical protein
MSETTTSSPDGAPTPQTFSLEYVKELRSEAKATRLKAQELEAQLEQAKAASKTLADEFETKRVSLEQAAKDRLIRAELKSHALKAGMIDLDGLKLLDTSKISLTEDGELEGAETLLEAAKKQKPWLFGVTNSTSTAQQPPKPAEIKQRSALEMSDEELAAFEREHGIIRPRI